MVNIRYVMGLVMIVVLMVSIYFFSGGVWSTTNTNVSTVEEIEDTTDTFVSTQDVSVPDQVMEETKQKYSPGNIEQKVPVTVIHSEYAYAVNDPKEAVNWASDVFIVKINEKIGEKSIIGRPRTQFSAAVISSIKGSAHDRVVINQSGVGYIDGQFFVNEGDIVVPGSTEINPNSVLLKVGGVYLFVTKYNSAENWYTISAPPYDRELISVEASSNNAALNFARQNPRVQQFVTAARELGVLNEEWR